MASKKSASSPAKQDAGKRFKASLSSGTSLASLLPEEISLLIKQTVEVERETLRDLVTEMLSETLTKALTTVESQIAENGTLLRSLNSDINTHAKNMEKVSAKVDTMQGVLRQTKKDTNHCLTELDTLRRKVTEMEDRSRRNNVRLINLPTGAEGDDPVGFLCKMLPQWIPTLSGKSIEIDRVHRIFSANLSRPHTMIFRVLRYRDRQAILQGARNTKPKLSDNTQLEFYADYSAETVQRRNKYKTIRAQLRQKGIDSFLIYPAILKLTYKGDKLLFDSAEEAEMFFAGQDATSTQPNGNNARFTARESLHFTDME